MSSAPMPRPLPFAVDPRDTFVVSYPKSGNTWVRFLFANLVKGGGEPVDFHEVERLVPEPELKPELLGAVKAPRVCKSHATYHPGFPRVIYLVRDPRDVLISYFEYTRKRLGQDATLDGLLGRQEKLAYGTWGAHVRSWYGQPRVSLFRYEDLRRDPLGVFAAMVRVAELACDDAAIAAAVEASSFARMKEAEEAHGRPFLSAQDRDMATPFMREGRAGGWRDRLTPDQIDQILRYNLREMLLLGYLPDPYQTPAPAP